MAVFEKRDGKQVVNSLREPFAKRRRPTFQRIQTLHKQSQCRANVQLREGWFLKRGKWTWEGFLRDLSAHRSNH
jgi:hypothetical protein